MSSKEGKKKTSILAFAGGLAFVSVATGIILAKNESIRTEVESQIKTLLSTSRELLHKLSLTDKLLSRLSSNPKTANNKSTIAPANTDEMTTAYDSLWQTTEQLNAMQSLDQNSPR